jgi:hypothetical protein
MRPTRSQTPRGGACPEQLVLDSWLDDAGPYLRLTAEGRGDERIEASGPAAAVRRPALQSGRLPQA